jgi:hypothetical protein
VFFVRCELRLKKQLRTALFCVTVQNVMVISYQRFGTTDWSHLLDSDSCEGPSRLSGIIGNKLPPLAA